MHRRKLVAALALATAGCHRPAPIEPPADPTAALPQRTAPAGSTGARQPMRFAPDAMDGASCEIRIDSAWIMAVSEAYAFTPTWHPQDRTMRLQVARAAMRMAIEDQQGMVVFEPDRIEERGDGKAARVKRAADDPPTARKLEALMGAPHVMLKLDESASVTAFRNDFAEKESAALIGVYWFAGMPVFPGEVAVGDRWIAERPFPSPAPVLTPSIALQYELQTLRDGVATIAISTAPIQQRRAPPARDWHLEGIARVRTADGAFLASDLRGALGDANAPLHIRWSIVARCNPAPP